MVTSKLLTSFVASKWINNLLKTDSWAHDNDLRNFTSSSYDTSPINSHHWRLLFCCRRFDWQNRKKKRGIIEWNLWKCNWNMSKYYLLLLFVVDAIINSTFLFHSFLYEKCKSWSLSWDIQRNRLSGYQYQ